MVVCAEAHFCHHSKCTDEVLQEDSLASCIAMPAPHQTLAHCEPLGDGDRDVTIDYRKACVGCCPLADESFRLRSSGSILFRLSGLARMVFPKNCGATEGARTAAEVLDTHVLQAWLCTLHGTNHNKTGSHCKAITNRSRGKRGRFVSQLPLAKDVLAQCFSLSRSLFLCLFCSVPLPPLPPRPSPPLPSPFSLSLCLTLCFLWFFACTLCFFAVMRKEIMAKEESLCLCIQFFDLCIVYLKGGRGGARSHFQATPDKGVYGRIITRPLDQVRQLCGRCIWGQRLWLLPRGFLPTMPNSNHGRRRELVSVSC